MPLLSKFSQDLTQDARQGKLQPAYGCETIFPAVFERLAAGAPHWIVVTGPPASGKSRFVEGLIWTCAKAAPSTRMSELSFLRLDLQAFAAAPEQGEEALKELLAVLEHAPHLVLVIDDAGPLLGVAAAPPGLRTCISTLNPLIRRAEVRSITVLPEREYSSLSTLPVAVPEQTYTVRLGSFDRDRRLALLAAYGPILEQKHRVAISPVALHAAATLPKQFMEGGQRPAIIMETLDKACLRFNRKTAAAEKNPDWLRGTSLRDLGTAVGAYDVVRTVEEQSGNASVQASVLKGKNALAAKMKERLPGQRDAVYQLVNYLINYRFGLSSPWAPAGLFVFWARAHSAINALIEAAVGAALPSRDLLLTQDLRNFESAESIQTLLRAAARPARLGVLLLEHADAATPEASAALGRLLAPDTPTTLGALLRHRIIVLGCQVPPEVRGEADVKQAFADAYGPGFLRRCDAWVEIAGAE